MAEVTAEVRQQLHDEEQIKEEAGETVVEIPSTSPTADHVRPGCRGLCLTTFRQEFHVRNLGFNYDRHEAFKTSQWRWPTLVFVCYRLCLAIYSVSIVGWVASKKPKDTYRAYRPYLVWATNWSYIILMLHLVCSAIVVLTHAYRLFKSENKSQTSGGVTAENPMDSKMTPSGTVAAENLMDGTTTPAGTAKLPFYLKFEWFLFVVACGAAPVVTIVYWVFLAPAEDIPFLQNDSINQHLLNTVIVVLELAISAIPVRLLHAVYITLFGVVYTIFTLIYWAVDHNHIIYYSFTNWNKPTKSIISLVFLFFVVAPLLQLIIFCLYQLRLALYRRIYHESYAHPP